MRVLVACEFSGTVRDAFIKRGHDAYSNDLLPAEGPHLQMDCFEAIGLTHWDLVIMHPPCTALAVSGNRWYGRGRPKHCKRLEAVRWTMRLWNATCATVKRACLENPVGVLPTKPDQYIQPWQFGHGETKKTGLCLRNLPKLKPTNIVEGREQKVWRMAPSEDRWKKRSITYQGIADAMAEQWGGESDE